MCVCVFVSICLCQSVCLLTEPQGTLTVWCNVPKGRTLLAAPQEEGMCWKRGARKPGHISCGNGVITSPITGAITVGGLQKLGNKAYRHTDGHSCGDMLTQEIISNTRSCIKISLFVCFSAKNPQQYVFHNVSECVEVGRLGVLTSCCDRVAEPTIDNHSVGNLDLFFFCFFTGTLVSFSQTQPSQEATFCRNPALVLAPKVQFFKLI